MVLIDEVMIFDRASTAEEVENSTYGLVAYDSWLSVDPNSGTVPTDSSIPIQIAFDSTDLQPDTYTTTLSVSSNDPLNPLAQIPVTMTVDPTPGMGWVEGVVTDMRTGEPLQATIIAEGQPYTITSDLETGYYKLWLEEGSYTLQVNSEEHVSQSVSVDITAQQWVTQDFAFYWNLPGCNSRHIHSQPL